MSKNAKNDRAEAARKVLEADKARRRRTIAIQVAVVAVVVAAVIGGTVYGLTSSGGDSTASAPSAVDDEGALLVGNPDAPVTIQVVEDFQCPACQQFEAGFGSALDEYAAGDDVNVAYRGIAFLDRASTTDYSSRALNASACVMEAADTDVWKAFHAEMFAQQPSEGGAGLADSDLIAIAEGAGADDVASCIEDGTYLDWAGSTTDAAFDEGVTGTPTVFVNGEQLESFNPADIQAAVDEALAS